MSIDQENQPGIHDAPARERTLTFDALISSACVLFLAWFSMKFHMDNSNDSETTAYVNALVDSATHGTISSDATGHYTALAQYVLLPFVAGLQSLSGAYRIRAFVFAQLILLIVLYAAAYIWYRRLGLSFLTSLVGLILLSTSVVFARLIRGWELDKLIEPALFLIGGVAAWQHRRITLVAIAALAAVNGERGVFISLVALAGLSQPDGNLLPTITRWPVWGSLIVCAAEIAWFRSVGASPTVAAWLDLNPDRLVNVIGGLCLLPVLAVVWVGAAPPPLRRLFYILAPTWIVFVLATDRLEQGSVLLAPLALLFVPVTLAGVEQVVQAPNLRSFPRA